MSKSRTLALILQCLFTLTCSAQDEPALTIRGKIVSSGNGEPIPYATVALPRDGLNTISNEEGNFIFTILSPNGTEA